MTATSKLKVLVGCEESQEVTKAFRALGHFAFSCDLQPCSGGRPEWHLQMDVFEAIQLMPWDLAIFFPDCTYLTVSGNRWFKDQPTPKSGVLVGSERRKAREDAVMFVQRLYNCEVPVLAIENPIGSLSTRFKPPNQIIQPWMFGHGETKATCLWLKSLPKLLPTDVVKGRKNRIHKMPPSKDRAKLRAKTYPGVAKAMAMQWSEFLIRKGEINDYF